MLAYHFDGLWIDGLGYDSSILGHVLDHLVEGASLYLFPLQVR